MRLLFISDPAQGTSEAIWVHDVAVGPNEQGWTIGSPSHVMGLGQGEAGEAPGTQNVKRHLQDPKWESLLKVFALDTSHAFPQSWHWWVDWEKNGGLS